MSRRASRTFHIEVLGANHFRIYERIEGHVYRIAPMGYIICDAFTQANALRIKEAFEAKEVKAESVVGK